MPSITEEILERRAEVDGVRRGEGSRIFEEVKTIEPNPDQSPLSV